MTDLQTSKDEIQRMWQEAEIYESQGLYDHAVLVYQNILSKEPENRKAQAKVVQIQFTQRMNEPSGPPAPTADEFSPRLTMDLGLAYMGMSLYGEALEELRKVYQSSSVHDRSDALGYMATCQLRLHQFDEARATLAHVLSDEALHPRQKGEIIEEMVGTCIEEGLLAHARDLLIGVPDELKEFIGDYDIVVREVSAADSGKTEFAIFVEDTRTGAVYETDGEMEARKEEAEPHAATAVEMETAIPLNALVVYSFDNKNWSEGSVTSLSADWALLHLPEQVRTGDSLVLQIHLPRQGNVEPVWIISRISEANPDDGPGYECAAKARFVSFLPGGESILKGFIDEVVKDPSITSERVAIPPTRHPDRAREASDVLSSLAEKALSALEEQAERDRRARKTIAVDDFEAEVSIPARPKRSQAPRIRFSCLCGQVHVIPEQNIGRQGTCIGCGQTITVPYVHPRPDSLADQMVGKTVGGCRLLYKIGGGGMGGVFKGHHLALDVPVALKVLHSHLAEKDPVFIRRFIREARAAAKLQHPNIVGVMNVGFERGMHYLIMPYVGGGSAALLLAKIGKLPLAKVLQIGIEITRALGVAAENKMLHRDIKPANILFNTRGEAMLADLGLAKQYLDAQDTGITQTGITCGTPLYFSPEQAKGSQDLDIRSDIYSLGITLYHLLTGAPPFMGESAYVIFQKHVHDPLPPFRDPDIPIADSVFRTLQKMTLKKPAERYQNPQELLQALEDLKQELSESGKSPPSPSPQKKGLLERLGIIKSL